MIVFHEGLPRSGKSYEAVVKHILPSIKNGRSVYSNINGLFDGAEKIASLIGMSPNEVASHIITLSDEDVYNLQNVVPKDALIAIDEIQNYYPSGREKIPKETIKYIAEHAQHGHDIILMGQSFADVAPIWRRRTQRKIMFSKRTGIGRPDEYTWTAYEATAPEQFSKISSGGGKYDKKYFGTYKSHQTGTKNTSFAYEDDRTNVFKQKGFLWGIPLALIAVFFAISYLYDFFNEPSFAGAQVEKTPEPKPKPKEPAPQPVKKSNQETPVVADVQAPVVKEPLDYLDSIAQKYRLRLSAAIYDEHDVLFSAYIDAYDATDHLKERFFLADVQSLGWQVEHKQYGLLITKDDVSHVVRPFPLGDLYGRVNSNLARSL